jgi:hypothetical protein
MQGCSSLRTTTSPYIGGDAYSRVRGGGKTDAVALARGNSVRRGSGRHSSGGVSESQSDKQGILGARGS